MTNDIELQPQDERGRFIPKDECYDKLPKTKKLIEDFLVWGNRRGGDFSEKTKKIYRSGFRNFFKFVKKEYDEVTENDIKNFYIQCKNRNSKIRLGEKLGSYAVSRHIMTIKGLFRYAESEGYIEENPVKIKLPNNEVKNKFLEVIKDILTREEVDKLFASFTNPREDCMASLIYGLGLRVSEVLGIELNDILFDRNKIVIDGKGNKKRLNDLKPCVIKRINLWLMVRGNQPSNYLFVTKFGNKFSSAQVNKMLKKKCKELGISKSITAHSLRRTAITHMIEDGIPLPEIAKIVGHSDISMTMRYCQLAQMKTSYLSKFRDF